MKRWVIGLALMALPVVLVLWARETEWGVTLTAPKARQKGPANAPVTIVEYSDFQCPACARVQPDLKPLLARYEGRVRLVFKHYPLTRIHTHALQAAIAAECAGAQDRFWPFHDRLYETQAAWAPLPDATTTFFQFAREAKLNEAAFQTCLAAVSTRGRVEADAAEAVRRQIQSTPTFFVGNQRLVGGAIVTDGARAIEKELRR